MSNRNRAHVDGTPSRGRSRETNSGRSHSHMGQQYKKTTYRCLPTGTAYILVSPGRPAATSSQHPRRYHGKQQIFERARSQSRQEGLSRGYERHGPAAADRTRQTEGYRVPPEHPRGRHQRLSVQHWPTLDTTPPEPVPASTSPSPLPSPPLPPPQTEISSDSYVGTNTPRRPLDLSLSSATRSPERRPTSRHNGGSANLSASRDPRQSEHSVNQKRRFIIPNPPTSRSSVISPRLTTDPGITNGSLQTAPPSPINSHRSRDSGYRSDRSRAAGTRGSSTARSSSADGRQRSRPRKPDVDKSRPPITYWTREERKRARKTSRSR